MSIECVRNGVSALGLIDLYGCRNVVSDQDKQTGVALSIGLRLENFGSDLSIISEKVYLFVPKTHKNAQTELIRRALLRSIPDESLQKFNAHAAGFIGAVSEWATQEVWNFFEKQGAAS